MFKYDLPLSLFNKLLGFNHNTFSFRTTSLYISDAQEPHESSVLTKEPQQTPVANTLHLDRKNISALLNICSV